MTIKNPFEALITALASEGVLSWTIDAPQEETGEWWLDVVFDGMDLSLNWRSPSTFGIFTSDESYGQRPDEVFSDVKVAAMRVIQLAKRRQKEEGGRSLTLRDIRQLVATSQATIAEMMSKNQAEISRLETRDDAKLSTILGYIAALGGEVEINVKFDTFSGPLVLNPSTEKRRRESHAA